MTFSNFLQFYCVPAKRQKFSLEDVSHYLSSYSFKQIWLKFTSQAVRVIIQAIDG